LIKGYTARWTGEVFTVSEVRCTDPITYRIVDYNNEENEETFYEKELQKDILELFRIEKIIKKQENKSLVKWLGYPDTFNSWAGNSDLVAL